MSTNLVIDHLPHLDVANPDGLAGKERDCLRLTSEQRRWVRGRLTTAAGREVGLALPTGTVLAPDAVLWVDENWFLAVEAAPEPVLRVTPPDAPTAIRYAFEVGNRHFPLALDGADLLVPDDSAMVQLLDRLGASWHRDTAVFRPVGRAHSHDHPDAHPHAHPHAQPDAP